MIYLIKQDGTHETFTNVIDWDKDYVTFKAGKGTCKIYANEGEYFTDTLPEGTEE
jgi:hypothetical protein